MRKPKHTMSEDFITLRQAGRTFLAELVAQLALAVAKLDAATRRHRQK